MWANDNLNTADIPFLLVMVYDKPNRSKNHNTTLFITYCLHIKVPCKHNNQLNVWAMDVLAPLDMLFLNHVHASLWPAHVWFLKIAFVWIVCMCMCGFACVCVCVCVCVRSQGY